MKFLTYYEDLNNYEISDIQEMSLNDDMFDPMVKLFANQGYEITSDDFDNETGDHKVALKRNEHNSYLSVCKFIVNEYD